MAIVYCPERVLPGRILHELIANDCVIGVTPLCARKALGSYRRLVRGACVTSDARAAEMTKLVKNAFREVSIAIDPWFLVAAAEQTPLIRAAREVSDGTIAHVVAQATALIEAHPDPIARLGWA